ncbi:hypothetical protein L1887_51926 [Cichorium endivia]|nr:hypothetical protein L1887_51926 [Cichorium endivia]
MQARPLANSPRALRRAAWLDWAQLPRTLQGSSNTDRAPAPAQPASPHVSRHCHPSTPPSRPSTHILRQNGKLAYDTMPTATQPASPSAHIHAELPAVSYRPRTPAASRSIESLEHRPTTRPHKCLCCPSALQQLRRPSHPCMSSARSQTRTWSCCASRMIEGHPLRSEIVVD